MKLNPLDAAEGRTNNTVELYKVNYSYPSSQVQTLTDISLPVNQGSVWGLLGPNGAGKTTIIRCITGLLEPNSGEVRLFGKTPDRQMLSRVGVLIENAGIYRKLYPREYLTFFGNLFEVEDLSNRIKQLSEEFELDLDKNTLGKMSLGQKQQVQLMRTLLAKPGLVIWDEPFSNLDPRAQLKVKEIILRYADKWGMTVILATHMLNQAEEICDNVFFIEAGKNLYSGTKNHLYKGDNILKCVSIELRSYSDNLPLEKWRNQFSLKVDFTHRPDYLDRRSQLRDTENKEKLFFSGPQLDGKIPEIVDAVIKEGYSIGSVVPEKKDLYHIYSDMMENSAAGVDT